MKTQTIRRMVPTLVLALCALSLPTLAIGREFAGYVDGPIVVGDQIFNGGRVELVEVNPTIFGLNINGQRVAAIYRESIPQRDRNENGKRGLLVVTDQRGYNHIVGIQYPTLVGAKKSVAPIHLAALAQGIEVSEPAMVAQAQATALASR